MTASDQSTVSSYQYDDANRLTNAGGVAYTFDANGNLLSDGVNTYAYDSANRLISVSNQSSVSSYTYNGLGDRLTQNGTQYVLDLNAGLTQVLSDGTNVYTYGLGRISQTNTTTEYFLTDALGSVRQLTNVTGDVTLAKSYDPYGNVINTAGTGNSPFAFTGEQQDASGLTYLRARYYNPADGRFMSRDTWEGNSSSPMSYNKWNYTDGNPINRTDHSGKCWYWDAKTEKIEINPFEGSASDPCKFFADIMELQGIHVSTPEEWLKNIPPEVRSLLSCGGGNKQDEYFWESPYPIFGTPTNFGDYLTGYSQGTVSGVYQQFGLHGEYEDTLGVGTFLTVTASVSFRIRYDVEKFENAAVLTLFEDYDIHPPEWVDAVGLVNLDFASASGFHTAHLGDIAYTQ